MGRSLQRLLWVSAVTVVGGCMPGTSRTESLQPRRSEEECQAVRDSVAAGLVAAQPPRPTHIVLPPRRPDALRGQSATLRFEVDTAGRVVGDRIQVTGIADEAFAAKLKASARTYRFRPAAANGCALQDTYELIHAL